jgi:hypothetical protein
MFVEDQELRHTITADNLEETLAALRALDARHREPLVALVESGQLETPYDYFRASILFLHQTTGGPERNAQVGLELALVSMRLGCADAPLAAARAYDRLLVDLGRGQRFGTQHGPSGEPRPMDPSFLALDDSMRRWMGVPVASEASEGR